MIQPEIPDAALTPTQNQFPNTLTLILICRGRWSRSCSQAISSNKL